MRRGDWRALAGVLVLLWGTAGGVAPPAGPATAGNAAHAARPAAGFLPGVDLANGAPLGAEQAVGGDATREAERPWARLGPPGPTPVVALAASPDWPADPLLLAARRDDLLRSPDAGATWERLPLPFPRLTALHVAPAAAGSRVAFALAPGGLHRSPDAGATWQDVLPLPGERLMAQLVLSPAFVRDGRAWLVADGALYQSDDSGVAWRALDPAPGQRVQQVAVSPAFADDQTLFVAATSADFPAFSLDGPHDQPATDHLDSAGVLVSTDGGATWQGASTGLAVDDVPFRHVQHLAVAPTYATDRTLFAFAWGPREPGPFMGESLARSWQAALFRSRDGGTSWEPVRTRGPSFARGSVTLALSPTFASDGIALLSESTGGLSPASHGCAVLRSGDGGATWGQVVRPGSYEGCGPAYLIAGDGGLEAVVRKGPGWLRSPDGGLSWEGFGPPEVSVQSVAVPSPRAGGVLVGGTFGGVWARGPGMRETNGRLPCPADAGGGFGRVWQDDPWVRDRLGCPLAPEQPVAIREAAFERGPGYWPENDWPEWFELYGPVWSARAKAERPWPAPPARVLEGAGQRFAGGVMLWLPQPDGRRTILVLAEPGQAWREVPD